MARREVIWSEEAERACLGCMFVGKPPAINAVMIRLTAEDFFRPAHQVAFRAASELVRKRQKPDMQTVVNVLTERGELQTVGGVDYVISCAEAVVNASNAAEYAEIVRRDASCRKVLEACQSASKKLVAREELEEAQTILREVTKPTGVGGCTAISDLDLSTPVKGKKSLLDLVNCSTECNGWPEGQTSIIGAYPGGGKTTLLIQDFIHATESGERTVYATFGDLSSREIMSKVMRQTTGWSRPPRQAEMFSPDEWQKTLGDWQIVYDASLYEARKVQGGRGRRIDVFCDEMRAHHDKGGLDRVYVDYIQKIHPAKKGGSEVEDLKAISDELQILAEELSIPVLVGTQLTNTTDGPQPKSCRAIYEDCALAVYIYWQNGFQVKDLTQPLWQLSRPDEPGGKVKLRLYKNRVGVPGWREAEWLEQFSKMEELSR